MKIQSIIAASAASLILISCGSGTEGTPVKQTGTTTSKENKKEGLHFKQGEEVKLGDFVIKINKVEDYKPTDEMMRASEGMKLVALEVEYSNPTTDKQLSANPFNWAVNDNESYAYEYSGVMGEKEPSLNATTINPGGKVKGWITFEIPKANKLTKAQFKPNFIDEANVEFEL